VLHDAADGHVAARVAQGVDIDLVGAVQVLWKGRGREEREF
jgi:hypothetical protein